MATLTDPSLKNLNSRPKFLETSRRDAWWLQSLLTFIGLGTFVVYATFRALKGGNYDFGGYLSPFFSPEIFGDSPHAWFGPKPGWIPAWLPFTPALLILPFPAGFRLTCYYYRGAYYKAFWADPSACAVGEPRDEFRGENSFPLILQNVHRYFMYAAILFLFFLAHDVWKGLWFDDGAGHKVFGVGVGTIVLAINVTLLSGYTFGCHSLRHLIGGYLDQFSKHPARAKAFACVTCFNKRHMYWAWASLIWVMFTDTYVRLCSMGVWHDWRIF